LPAKLVCIKPYFYQFIKSYFCETFPFLFEKCSFPADIAFDLCDFKKADSLHIVFSVLYFAERSNSGDVKMAAEGWYI